MSAPPKPAPAGMARVIARLDAAFGETVPNRALARLLDVGESSLRRWRKGDPLAEDVVVRTAAALGLEPGQVRGYDRLPENWPPPALLARLGREKRWPGRPPKPPAAPAPTAPPEMHRLVAELRELMAAMRGGVAPPPALGHVGSTKVGLAGVDDMDTAERLAVLAERLEAMVETIATHDAATLGLWEGAAAERQAIIERLERIERILSRPLDASDAAPAANGDAAD